MPIYKGNTEIASGKLYKAAINIENGYKGTDSFYINEVTISFLNFPGVSDYSITGGPGETIPGNRYQQWTASATSGYAFNGAQTAVGLPTDFTFTGGSQGSTSNTTTSPRVNYSPSVFPTSSVSVDYNNLAVSLPQTQVVTFSYTFTGGLARSTSCTAFSGSACSVSSASASGGNWKYFTANASGTGGSGANTCSNYCSVSISSSGGSSSCDSSGQTANQSANINMVAVPTYAVGNPTGWRSVLHCTTINTGPVFGFCGGGQLVFAAPGQPYSGGAQPSNSCGTPPAAEISPPQNGYQLVGRDLNGTASGTWNGEYRDGGGVVKASASAVTP